MGSNDRRQQHDTRPRQLDPTSIGGRVTRRAFLRAVAVGSGLGLLACTPAATPSPTAPVVAKPTEPAKPAAPAPATTAPAAAPVAAPTAAAAAASKPAETPRRGGELVYVVSAEPPSYDGHR